MLTRKDAKEKQAEYLVATLFRMFGVPEKYFRLSHSRSHAHKLTH